MCQMAKWKVEYGMYVTCRKYYCKFTKLPCNIFYSTNNLVGYMKYKGREKVSLTISVSPVVYTRESL